MSFVSMGLLTKHLAITNARGISKIYSGKPYGSYFWDDVMKIDIGGITSEGRLLVGNLPQIRLSNLHEHKRTTNNGPHLGFLVYASFFQSTKTVKRITSAVFDILVLVILALYRQRLIITYNLYVLQDNDQVGESFLSIWGQTYAMKRMDITVFFTLVSLLLKNFRFMVMPFLKMATNRKHPFSVYKRTTTFRANILLITVLTACK